MKSKILRQIWLMSKLTLYGFIIQLAFFGLLSAKDGFAQSKSIKEVYLNLNVHNEQLKVVFNQIEEKTGFGFTYSKDLVNDSFRINTKIENGSLENLLLSISEQTGLSFKRINDNIYVNKRPDGQREVTEKIEEIPSQGIEVSGRVTSSEDQTGLPGVNVIVKGTSHGTVTDVEGNYKINVPNAETVLEFSSVGFVSESITVGSQSTLNVTLVPDVKALSEIVVVGYGTMKRSNVTAAITTVPSKDFKDMPTSNVATSLQGKLPGVVVQQTSGNPGSTPAIKVRGFGSISAGTSPLIVVDGNIVTPEVFSTLTASEIESVDVLKDASSTAIFGSRGVQRCYYGHHQAGQTRKNIGNF